ncbi:MAG: Gfo/Idh/MocA family oxidoreductase [Solobacterium sp.]|nr:Gfo/Idh/MocA family oxidoreductase [Solobacterium sp.]
MKWGILSTGTIANKFAATVNMMLNEGEALQAVASRDLTKAEQFAVTYEIPQAYGSYEELLCDPEVEAVYIATPNNLHYQHTKMCLEAGKHVLCEKPFTTSAKDARELYQLAEERNLFVMEGFWIRFLPLYETLLPMIHSKKWGELRHARVEYGFIAEGQRRTRKFVSELGGGALLDIGIYNLGFLYMVMGHSPKTYTSTVRFNEFGTDEFSVLQLQYPGDKTAHSLQAIGLKTDRNAALFFDRAVVYLPDFQSATSFTVEPVGEAPYEVKCPMEINGFEYEIREVTRCVSEGKSHSEIFRPEDSLAVLELMDEIRASWDMKFSFEEGK